MRQTIIKTIISGARAWMKRTASPHVAERSSALSVQKRSSGTTSRPGDYEEFFAAIGTGLSQSMKISTVAACVKLLSDSVAVLPLNAMRKSGSIYVEDDDFWYLLNISPNWWESAFDFKKRLVIELLLDGNAYILPVYDPLRPVVTQLILCERGTVVHNTINDTYTYQGEVYPADRFIHVKNYPSQWDPKVGVSVLSHASFTLDIAAAGDTETLKRFTNGGGVRGIISNDSSVRGFGPIQDEQLEKLAESLDIRFKRGEGILSTPGDSKFSQISLSSVDMQFLETRKFTIPEICRFFMVNPSFIFADTASNYKLVEQANADFLNKTLNPILVNIENAFARVLVGQESGKRRKIEFDRRQVFAGDFNMLLKNQQLRLQLGTATINELRIEENKHPVELGDTPVVSANLKTLSQLITEQNQHEKISKNPSDK